MNNYIVVILFLFFSCQTQEHKNGANVVSLVPKQVPTIVKDTTITYDIEGISSEGTEAIAKYVDGKIKECVINVYAERGQIQLQYIFLQNQIEVTEKQFGYKNEVQNVTSEKDMLVKKKIKYYIDFGGKPIGKVDKGRLDIFEEFKGSVPFRLE